VPSSNLHVTRSVNKEQVGLLEWESHRGPSVLVVQSITFRRYPVAETEVAQNRKRF
jgi:hypothetical protein